jgi:hypothetical protein
VFFQMLTGKVPFERQNSVATLFAHAYEPPPSLEGPVAEMHPTLGPVIAKAMAKEPGDRYFSAGDLARDAAAALHGARYTGAPTLVATGEARPQGDEHEEERAQAALVVLEAAMQQPTTAGASEATNPGSGPPTTISPAAPETVAAQPSIQPPENEDWVGTTPSHPAPGTAERPATAPAAADGARPPQGDQRASIGGPLLRPRRSPGPLSSRSSRWARVRVRVRVRPPPRQARRSPRRRTRCRPTASRAPVLPRCASTVTSRR